MSRKFTKLILSGSVAAVAITGMAVPSFAQTPTVVVTAQRRAQNLQDVPVAVTAFTSEAMAIRQINETLDIVNMVPNLFGFNNTGPATSNAYFLRGLGSTESIATFDPPVSTYIDDVYVTRQNANNYALFDIERIEVLRGPQGTTFGRNTTGGAINVITRKPGEEFAAKAEAEYGRFDRFSFNGTVDVPVTDQILTKISGYYVTDDGFVSNLTTGETLNGEDSHGIRGDIRVMPNDDITWDVAVEYMGQKGSNVLSAVGGDPRTSNTGISTSGTTGDLGNLLMNGGGFGNEAKTFAAYSNLKIDITDSATLEFITGYRDLDQDFTLDFFDTPIPTGGFTIVNNGEHKQFTQEAKINGNFALGGWDIDYVGGVFYLDEDNDTDFADIFLGSLVIDRTLANETNSIAVYGQVDIGLTDWLTITGGGRWTREKKTIDFSTNLMPTVFGFTNLAALSGGVTTANISALGIPTEQVAKQFTPRVAIEAQATDDILLYASMTRGFKSGGWNARATSPGGILPFAPEQARTYEAGIKSDWYNNTLRFNGNFFYSKIKDLQLISGVPVPPLGAIEFLTQNAGELKSWGFEAEIAATPLEGLDVFANLGLIDDEYQNLDPSSSVAIAGAEPVRTPDITLNLGGTYRHGVPNTGGDFVGSVEGTYYDDMFVGSTNPVGSLQEAFWTMRASMGWESEDGRYGIFGECKNCTNTTYITSFFVGAYYAEPARYTISLRAKY